MAKLPAKFPAIFIKPFKDIEEANKHLSDLVAQINQLRDELVMVLNGNEDKFTTDEDATALNTRGQIYDVDNAQLERISVGIVDSGGSGFKVLRIAN